MGGGSPPLSFLGCGGERLLRIGYDWLAGLVEFELRHSLSRMPTRFQLRSRQSLEPTQFPELYAWPIVQSCGENRPGERPFLISVMELGTHPDMKTPPYGAYSWTDPALEKRDCIRLAVG